MLEIDRPPLAVHFSTPAEVVGDDAAGGGIVGELEEGLWKNRSGEANASVGKAGATFLRWRACGESRQGRV